MQNLLLEPLPETISLPATGLALGSLDSKPAIAYLNAMKIVVDEKLTRQVAHLARLSLTDEEITTYTVQFGNILGYVEKLQEVDVGDIAPLTHPFDLPTPLRADVVKSFSRDHAGKSKALSCAPELLSDGFKVPQIK